MSLSVAVGFHDGSGPEGGRPILSRARGQLTAHIIHTSGQPPLAIAPVGCG